MKNSKRNDELKKYLRLIGTLFNVDKIVNGKQQNKQIKNYYLTNHFAYLFFHNKRGFMHMGLSDTPHYKEEDLQKHLLIIQKLMDETNTKRVLELGAGNGSNSAYLANNNPSVEFRGLDLSKQSLQKKITNYHQEFGDFHKLDRYKDNSFDLVFVIEALCHSNHKNIVLHEVYKKLKKGGLFVIFDGYLNKVEASLNNEELIAKKLTEKSMAVNNFEHIKDFETKAITAGFVIQQKEDFSLSIMPTLMRFEKLSLILFWNKPVSKIIKSVLPFDLIKNSIAGLLMPTLIDRKIACYYLHVLIKQ